MAGSPQYLSLLDSLRPVQGTYKELETAWDDLVHAPHQPASYINLAQVAFSILAEENIGPDGDLAGAWHDTIAEAKSLHIRKNAGYAGMDNPDPWANFRISSIFGINPIDGVLVRMSDKKIRIENLMKNPLNDQVGESITDTIRDLAAYSLIALCLWDEEHEK